MSPALRRCLCWLAAALALVCATVLVTLLAGRPLFYSDGLRLASALDLRDASMIAWSRPEPVMELPGLVRGRVEVLPDGRVLYGREVAETDTELVMWDPRRKDLAPEPVAGLSTKAHELSPFLAKDGTLYFASDREGGAGGFDLWSVPWRDGRVGTPTALPDGINTAFDEIDPTCDRAATTIVFARRDDGRDARLFIALLAEPARCQPVFADEIDPRRNGTAAGRIVMDREPCWSADDASLWFVREMQGTPATLLRSARLAERFAEPYDVGIGAGFLAPRSGLHELWLLGAPALPSAAAGSEGKVGLLYRSRAEELVPWHDAQRLIERILLSTLCAALLTLVLLLLGKRFTKLDLITICLLASLLLHLVVLLWLGRVEIVRHLSPPGGGEGRLEVMVVSALDGDARALLGGSGLVDEARMQRHQGELEARAPGTGLEPQTLASGERSLPLEAPTKAGALEAPAGDLRDAVASVESARRRGEAAGAEVRVASGNEPAAPSAAAGVTPLRSSAKGGMAELVTAPPTELGALAAQAEPARADQPRGGVENEALVASAAVAAPKVAALHDVPQRGPSGQQELRAAGADPSSTVTPMSLAQELARPPSAALVLSAPRPAAVGPSGVEPGPVPASDLAGLVIVAPRESGAPPPAAALAVVPMPAPASALHDVVAPGPAAPVRAASVARGSEARGSEAGRAQAVGQAAALIRAAEVAGAGPGAGGAAPRPERTAATPERGERQMAPPSSDLSGLLGDAKPLLAAAPRADVATPVAAPPRTDLRDPRAGLARAGGPRANPLRGPADPGRPGALATPAEVGSARSAKASLGFAPLRALAGSAAEDIAVPVPPGSFLEPAALGQRSVLDRVADVSPYQNRFGPLRAEALERFGGSVETEAAVAAGLSYLAKIQQEDGAWGMRPINDPKYGDVRVGKTGLCLLAFLGAGHLPGHDGPHRALVERAIYYLLEQQDDTTGHFGRTSAYDHGIATYALAECYGLTREQKLSKPLERALDWILKKQNRTRDPRNEGGWGYFSPTLQPEDRFSRSAITAWMVMALESAKLAGFTIDGNALGRAREFLLRSFDEEHGYFLYAKEPGRLASGWRTLPASTPASVFALSLLGVGGDDYRLRAGLEYTIDRKPARYRRADSESFVMKAAGNVYFWYYGSLACFLAGGTLWEDWNAALKRVLLPAQAKDGSFAPIDVYADQAGDTSRDRAYTTAMCVLSLEVYYRYFTPLLKAR